MLKGWLNRWRSRGKPLTRLKPVIIPRDRHPVSRKNISPAAVKTLYRLHDAGHQAFLIGATAPEFGSTAATTDQTGGWAALRVSGDAAAEVLMRHIPLDLRVHAFAPGRAVRAPLGHMSAVVIRDEAGFLILIFRSMVRTAWHEIETAMRSVAARA